MSANEQKIGHFSIDLQRTTKTTEHTLTAKLQSTIVHVTKTLVIIFGHWNRKKQKQKQAFSCKQADPPLRVCFKSSNLVPRVFSLSNMAAAGEKTLAHSELKRSLIGAFHGAFIRALSLVCYFQKQRFWLFDGFVETEKCFLQSLGPKKWTEFRSDCLENCDCTVWKQTRRKFTDLILTSIGVQRVF